MSETSRFTRQQALDLFHSPDLIGLGFEADAVRRQKHPEGVVTYIIDRNINYTNFCTEYCTFCAFYRPLKGARSEEGYILDFDVIYDKIAETLEMGGTGVLMQGGIHPDLKIDWFERLFSGIKQRFPQIWLHCLTDFGHRQVFRNFAARHDSAPARRGARFDSRRRR
jgi:cyclic dehypoxanthinyl futalosine synthase